MSPSRSVAGSRSAELAEAVLALRNLLLSGMHFRMLVAEHFGIDLSASIALSHLSTVGPLTARQLAEQVGVTPSAMTALLDRLEAQGLATRNRHPTDRRKTVATITETGQKSLQQVREWLADALGGIDVDALPQTTRLLTAIAHGLDEQCAAIRDDAGAAD